MNGMETWLNDQTLIVISIFILICAGVQWKRRQQISTRSRIGLASWMDSLGCEELDSELERKLRTHRKHARFQELRDALNAEVKETPRPN